MRFLLVRARARAPERFAWGRWAWGGEEATAGGTGRLGPASQRVPLPPISAPQRLRRPQADLQYPEHAGAEALGH